MTRKRYAIAEKPQETVNLRLGAQMMQRIEHRTARKSWAPQEAVDYGTSPSRA